VKLEAIADQPRALALLQRAIDSGRIAHAWAFIGPPGSGRTTTALAFAAALLCERGGCGACRACALVEARQHPDLHLIVPTPPPKKPKGTPLIRIDAIRELERQAALRPVMAPRKVFILDDAERLTSDAPQAFLKTLEEPPADTVLVLVLPRPGAVPATVLSRCQVVRFEPRGTAAGARGDALALVEETRAKRVDVLFRRSQSVDREKAEALVDAWWLFCRDLLLARAGVPPELLTEPGGAEALAREAEAWSEDAILAVIEACRAARLGLQSNVSPRLTVEVLAGRLAFGGKG